MQAIWSNKVLAEAENDDLIYIEGNWYFPPSKVNKDFLKESDHKTTCFWKGEASYYDVVVDSKINENAAWFYPEPMEGSVQRVRKDFKDYIAFWHGVEVKES